MEEKKPALYSNNLRTKSKTYFFDVKEAKNGNKYLTISESWMKNGEKFRSSITVFEDCVADFAEIFAQVQSKLK